MQIVELGDLYIVDRPRHPDTDIAFWNEYSEWVWGLPSEMRPLEISRYDVIFTRLDAAILYVMRWG